MAQPKKFKTGIEIDGTISHADGGSASEVFATDGSRQTITTGPTVSTDAGNEISSGGDGGAFFQQDMEAPHALTQFAWHEGYCVFGLETNYSNISTLLDPITARDLFLMKTTSGTWRLAHRNSGAYTYDLNGKWLTAIDGKTVGTKFTVNTDTFVEFHPVNTNGAVYGDYTVYSGQALTNGGAGFTDGEFIRFIGKAYFGAEGGGGGGLTESQVINTSRQYNNQQNFNQQALTDAATLTWDLDTAQAAILTATGAVGNTRTLPNSVITAGVDGGNYQLTFVQDATGGRSISFDTSFNVVGTFDLAANKRTLITVVVQGSEADVVLTPIIDPEQPQALTGNVLDLSKYFGNTYNYATPLADTTYTFQNPVVNGFARVYINAATEPTVTGATKIYGDDFVASVTMEMIVESPDGTNAEYYFIQRS